MYREWWNSIPGVGGSPSAHPWIRAWWPQSLRIFTVGSVLTGSSDCWLVFEEPRHLHPRRPAPAPPSVQCSAAGTGSCGVHFVLSPAGVRRAAVRRCTGSQAPLQNSSANKDTLWSRPSPADSGLLQADGGPKRFTPVSTNKRQKTKQNTFYEDDWPKGWSYLKVDNHLLNFLSEVSLRKCMVSKWSQ